MVKAIVGANWGDEGKGKITDMLAETSDVVIRYQGGANAGHTIINDQGRFALHHHRQRSGAGHPQAGGRAPLPHRSGRACPQPDHL